MTSAIKIKILHFCLTVKNKHYNIYIKEVILKLMMRDHFITTNTYPRNIIIHPTSNHYLQLISDIV